MKNVHEFDRKINIQIKPDSTDQDFILNQFLNQPILSEDAKKMTRDIILNSSGKNKDEINGADARELLVQLLVRIEGLEEEDKKKDMYFLLNEQLQDMIRLGPCAQGRTIRLWQLLQCCI